jgi:hypothetical protein
MRRFGLAVTLLVAAGLVASSAWAKVPDCTHSTVGSGIINACPYNHPYGASDAERYQDITVTLLTDVDEPVDGFPAANFQFTFTPHSSYPTLGGGPSGDCPDCENHYTATCQYTETDANGEMVVRIEVGPECSPSMCCPVEVAVNLVGACEIVQKISILQNSHDLVANGDVRAPDFGAFTTAYNGYIYGATLQPCADFVFSSGATYWGEMSGSDFSAFTTHYKDCCGRLKEPNPALCGAWTDPCP